MNQAVFAPKARQEILRALHWISRDNPVAAQAFCKAEEKQCPPTTN